MGSEQDTNPSGSPLFAEREPIYQPHALTSSRNCPALTLPMEITSEIFLHCRTYAPAPKIHHAPLVFTLVCSVWRNIAIGTSGLWDSMLMTPNQSTNADKYLYMADLWFSRAEERPLRLELHCNAVPRETSSEWGRRLSVLLERYSHQWQSVYFQTSFQFTDRSLIEFEFGSTVSFPHLRNLTISATHNFPGQSIIPIAAWKNTPSLRDVSLHSLSASNVVLPWGQLTNIQCVGITLPDTLNLLGTTPALVEFTLQGMKSTWHWPSASITLPCLRYLELSSDGLTILPCITAPLLQILNLVGGFRSAGHRLSSLLDFLSRSQCQLTELVISLRISLTQTQEQPEIRLLESLSSLETLRVETATTPDLAHIFMRLSDSSFLPRLEKLAVKGYEEDWEEDWVYEADPLHDVTKLTQEMFDRVVHGLALRRRPVDAAHLKSFSLESSSSLLKPIQPQVVEQLQALSAEGLDLYIQTGDQNWI